MRHGTSGASSNSRAESNRRGGAVSPARGLAARWRPLVPVLTLAAGLARLAAELAERAAILHEGELGGAPGGMREAAERPKRAALGLLGLHLRSDSEPGVDIIGIYFKNNH